MKPSPTYDFPVGVWRESANHPSPVDAEYERIYSVRLNHTFSIEFVPAFDRHAPWPPELPDDVDHVQSRDEARRTVIALARFAVTPDRERAGTTERITVADSEGVIFYVGPDDFDDLSGDLASSASEMSGVHAAVPISSLGGRPLARFLLERVLPSGHLTQRERWILGRDDA